jgi:hypothetical protein
VLFLVDYENVSKAGMKGSSFLDERDQIVIFYSEARKNAERRILEDITSSGCVFEVCKLCRTGKNALDFYIASRLGEMIGNGYEGISVIVSSDNGFLAVCDYWMKKALRKRKVFLAPTIEDGIVCGSENDARTKELKRLRENLSIGSYYSAYEERMRIKGILNRLFEGTAFAAMTADIQNLIEDRKKPPKVIYLNSLKMFGRKNGLEIYHRIRTCEELRA